MTSMLFARLSELFHFAIALLLLPSLNAQSTWTVTDGTATATLTGSRLSITVAEPHPAVSAGWSGE